MFKDYLASSKQHIEQWLGEVLTSPNREFKPLYESMNYSLMQGEIGRASCRERVCLYV